MKSCPHCKSTYPTNFSVCPQDAAKLVETSELAPGTLLRGKYKILSKLGEGGMGAVYKALHVRFEEEYALKLVLPEHLSDPAFLQRFQAEALLMRKLDHPHATRVHDVDETEDGLPFIVMELITGESLESVLSHGALPPARAIRIAAQACEALAAAHRLGIIHRDIKPANLLLTKTAEGADFVKVMDFGIAKVMAGSPLREGASVTQTGALVGTPAYMSPEQCQGARGAELTGASDLYSLGVVLYQMLSGSIPFTSDSTVGLILAHLQQTPPDLHALHPEIPAQLVAVVRRALEKDPAQRYATADEMRLALEEAARALDKTTIGPRPVPPPKDFELPATTRWETPRPGAFRAPEPAPRPARPSAAANAVPGPAAPQPKTAASPPIPAEMPPAPTPQAPAEVLPAPPPKAAIPQPPPPAAAVWASSAPSPAPQPAAGVPRKSGPSAMAGIAAGIGIAALLVAGVWFLRRGGTAPNPSGEERADSGVKRQPPASGPKNPSPARPSPGTPANSVPNGGANGSEGPGATLAAPGFVAMGRLAGSGGSILSVAFTPGGRILASGNMDNSIGLWDPAAQRALGRLSGHSGPVYSVAFSPDGKILASASGDNTARLWELGAGRVLFTLTGHRDRVYSVAFSPDGRTVATASKDHTVKLWNTATGAEIRTLSGHFSAVAAVAFSPDGRYLASGGEDNLVMLWDPDQGQLVRTLRGHSNFVHGLAFSLDGRTLASAGRDQTVRLWDADSGRALRTCTGHRGYVEAVAFSPDGRVLASGSEDLTVKLWDIESGQELRTLSGHSDWVIALAFRPDGKILATAGADKTIALWRRE